MVLHEDEDRQNEIKQFEEENEPHELFVVGFDSHFEILDFIFYFFVFLNGNAELDFLVVQVENVGQVDFVAQRHELQSRAHLVDRNVRPEPQSLLHDRRPVVEERLELDCEADVGAPVVQLEVLEVHFESPRVRQLLLLFALSVGSFGFLHFFLQFQFVFV